MALSSLQQPTKRIRFGAIRQRITERVSSDEQRLSRGRRASWQLLLNIAKPVTGLPKLLALLVLVVDRLMRRRCW